MRSLQRSVRPIDNARYVGRLRKPSAITALVIHATAGDTVDGAVSWLNRTLGNGEGKASYHYLLPKDDSYIFRMCDPLRVAYHAGYSHYPPVPSVWYKRWGSVNTSSVGIAFANDNGSDSNDQDDDLTIWQIESSLWLCSSLCRRFSIPASRVFAHHEVSPGRKTDPLPRILNMDEFRTTLSEYI